MDKDTESAIRKITDRNDIVHDYMNSGYYDDEVIKHIVNDYDYYVKYIMQIETYCKAQGYIK